MADANSTLDLSQLGFDKNRISETVGENIHKLAFIQGVLTLSGDGNSLPEVVDTSGLYYILEDIILGLKGVRADVASIGGGQA